MILRNANGFSPRNHSPSMYQSTNSHMRVSRSTNHVTLKRRDGSESDFTGVSRRQGLRGSSPSGGFKRPKRMGKTGAYYDDTQDQINSLEFMARSIHELENRLGDIEAKISYVKRILNKQDVAIKEEVIDI